MLGVKPIPREVVAEVDRLKIGQVRLEIVSSSNFCDSKLIKASGQNISGGKVRSSLILEHSSEHIRLYTCLSYYNGGE